MATEFLNLVSVCPCFFYTTGSVRPFPYFLKGGEYVCPSYRPLKFLKLIKSRQKSVRPFIIKLWNPYFQKILKN